LIPGGLDDRTRNSRLLERTRNKQQCRLHTSDFTATSRTLRWPVSAPEWIQRQFARYQAAQQQSDAAHAQISLSGKEPQSSARNLFAQFNVWRTQRAKVMQLQQARDGVPQKRKQLQQKHDSAEEPAPVQPNVTQSQEPPPSAGSSDQAVIASLRRLSERQKNLAGLDQRLQDHKDLADVYGSWIGVVQSRQQATLHGIIQSALFVVLIVVGVYWGHRAVDRLFTHLIRDRRRLRTLRAVTRFGVQAVGVSLVLFVLFGTPSQMPTVLGLAGAGLTVALKDFIVAFFGWFALIWAQRHPRW
jgi:hypothetical protein